MKHRPRKETDLKLDSIRRVRVVPGRDVPEVSEHALKFNPTPSQYRMNTRSTSRNLQVERLFPAVMHFFIAFLCPIPSLARTRMRTLNGIRLEAVSKELRQFSDVTNS